MAGKQRRHAVGLQTLHACTPFFWCIYALFFGSFQTEVLLDSGVLLHFLFVRLDLVHQLACFGGIKTGAGHGLELVFGFVQSLANSAGFCHAVNRNTDKRQFISGLLTGGFHLCALRKQTIQCSYITAGCGIRFLLLLVFKRTGQVVILVLKASVLCFLVCLGHFGNGFHWLKAGQRTLWGLEVCLRLCVLGQCGGFLLDACNTLLLQSRDAGRGGPVFSDYVFKLI